MALNPGRVHRSGPSAPPADSSRGRRTRRQCTAPRCWTSARRPSSSAAGTAPSAYGVTPRLASKTPFRPFSRANTQTHTCTRTHNACNAQHTTTQPHSTQHIAYTPHTNNTRARTHTRARARTRHARTHARTRHRALAHHTTPHHTHRPLIITHVITPPLSEHSTPGPAGGCPGLLRCHGVLPEARLRGRHGHHHRSHPDPHHGPGRPARLRPAPRDQRPGVAGPVRPGAGLTIRLLRQPPELNVK